MMLSAPFFCALHANSTRAFPQILVISSGTNVCGGVTSASASCSLHLGTAHLLTLYALNERPSSSKGAMIGASPCKQECSSHPGRSSRRRRRIYIFSENLGIVFGGQYVSKPVQNYDLETSKHNLKQPTNVLGKRWETCRIFDCHWPKLFIISVSVSICLAHATPGHL